MKNINNIVDELKWRDILKDISNAKKILENQKNKKGVYCGFDPTSNSLHIGNLIQLLVLKRFSLFGFKPYAIIGEGTAAIGDPSGKSSERVLKSLEEIRNNIDNIQVQIKKILPEAIILNNNSWLENITIINFLHDIGKNFNVSYLINKEHIKSRLEVGISYTEFTYTLLQAYDFLYLYNNYDVFTQIGGSDQWGNITSGIDYIKDSVQNSMAAGLTIQLLLKSDGNKFGKTEEGTIWLDRNKTNPYDFYQFFFNQDDKFCVKLLKYFSFYNENEINEINKKHLSNPKDHYIQEILASCLIRLVHSEKDLNDINRVRKILFDDEINNIDKNLINDLLVKIIPSIQIKPNINNILDVLVSTNICSSKREAREFINNKTIMINGKYISDINYKLDLKNSMYDKFFLIKKGKKKHFIIFY